MNKEAVVLINLGTPKSPKVKDVRNYLSEFLNDPFVIDINPIGRFFLVNLIIVPFRAPKSAKAYEQLWTPKGSPLMVYGRALEEKVRTKLKDQADVYLSMRYQQPSMESVFNEMEGKGYEKITVIPLYPQYATASTETIFVEMQKLMSGWSNIPSIKFVDQFYDHPLFIDTIIDRASKYNFDDYDHIIFSYHGLPKRQLNKLYSNAETCDDHLCATEINETNQKCYVATCYATTRLLVERLSLEKDQYSVGFQSRLGKGWVEPFTDHILTDLAAKGKKKVLVFCPAFVADCLETIVEIGIEYQEEFEEAGGEKVQLVESLNDHDTFVDCIVNIAYPNV